MTKVKLHGELARAMGRAEWEFLISQPREVMAALEANTGGKFYMFLRERHESIEYRIVCDGEEIGGVDRADQEKGVTPPEFYMTRQYRVIEIICVARGAGAGLWQTIIGVILIIVGIVLLFVPGTQGLAPYVILAGISLTVGGVAAMLSPSPKLSAASPFARTFKPQAEQLGQKKEDADGTPSYLFSGAVNTKNQGGPVPILYGEMIIGCAIVSMGISGTSVDAAVIGSQRPPKPNNDFYDLAVFDRLAIDSRRTAIYTQHTVMRMRSNDVHAQRLVFGIPETFPTTFRQFQGRPIPVGSAGRTPRNTLRGYLSTLSYIFSGNPRPVTFREAVDLYKVLELEDVDRIQRATWTQVIYAIAIHFSPDP